MIQAISVFAAFNGVLLRKLKVMDQEIIFLVEDLPEGGYEARASGHSIFTEADTYEDLNKMVEDAVNCYFGPENGPGRITIVAGED